MVLLSIFILKIKNNFNNSKKKLKKINKRSWVIISGGLKSVENKMFVNIKSFLLEIKNFKPIPFIIKTIETHVIKNKFVIFIKSYKKL